MDVITSVWPRTMDAPRSNILKLSFLNTHHACVPNPLFTEPSPAASMLSFCSSCCVCSIISGFTSAAPHISFCQEGAFWYLFQAFRVESSTSIGLRTGLEPRRYMLSFWVITSAGISLVEIIAVGSSVVVLRVDNFLYHVLLYETNSPSLLHHAVHFW